MKIYQMVARSSLILALSFGAGCVPEGARLRQAGIRDNAECYTIGDAGSAIGRIAIEKGMSIEDASKFYKDNRRFIYCQYEGGGWISCDGTVGTSCEVCIDSSR